MRLLDKSPVGAAGGYLFDTYPKGQALRISVNSSALTTNAAMPTGQWTHVVATANGRTGRKALYLNGRKIGEE